MTIMNAFIGAGILCLLFTRSCGTVLPNENGAIGREKDVKYGPANTAQVVGDIAVLKCGSTGDNSWIAWVEYATDPVNGKPVSEGENVLEGHPNEDRYKILHDSSTRYDLEINETILEDGGTYECLDINVAGSGAYAELIMLKTDPICITTIPASGTVNEGQTYSIECSVEYHGNVPPIMTWSGPEPFDFTNDTSNITVWSRMEFVAYESLEGEQYLCVTEFSEDQFNETDSGNTATNAPTYKHTYESPNLTISNVSVSTGSVTYIRWGRTICERTAELVYSGYAAGQSRAYGGGGSDYICLPETPKWEYMNPIFSQYGSWLYGVEYILDSYGQPFSFENNGGQSIQYHNAPCAVCLAKRSIQLMIPAATACPVGWIKEFQGYLVSSSAAHYRSSYVCLDRAPEVVPGEQASETIAYFYTVEASCYGLPCPDYVQGYEIACIVCTI